MSAASQFRRSALVLLVLLVSAAAPDRVVASATATNQKDFELVGFELLAAFNYVPPSYETMVPGAPPASAEAAPKNQIPDYVRELDAKKISITGFMLPTKFKNGKVTEFLLMKDQSGCCFGAMPRINEWIIVRMMQGGIPPLMDIPLTLLGKLKVGELYEEGYLSGIYQLEGEQLLDVKG
ncbi:MAG: DUF3299 domain-containing protein [Candidatus Didemnitutus sp.]|nr:DUF3299 domain-containing protein [Candidatus Didemnitutus sp.]